MFADVVHGFAVIAPGERRAQLAGAIRDDRGEAGVLRAGPQNGFTQARETEQNHALRVHVGVGLEIIHGAAGAPGPGADGTPVIRRRRREIFADAVFFPCAAGHIRLDFTV